MEISGIDRVVYGVEDMARGRAFFDDAGLKEISATNDEVVFETLNGAQVSLRPAEATDLPPAIESGSTARLVIWGVETDEAFDGFAKKLSIDLDDCKVTDNLITFKDPNGMAIGIRKTQRRKVQVTGSQANTIDNIVRINQPNPVYERAEPVLIGHVVFKCVDMPAMVEFYKDKLGFWESDSYEGKGTFLRCRANAVHHNTFLFQSPDDSSGLGHVAFVVRDIHEVMAGGLHLSKKGWSTTIGPGRHPVSSATFWYVANPCGGNFEYFADEDFYTEEWVPRKLKYTNENIADWAVEGGIDFDTRRQKK